MAIASAAPDRLAPELAATFLVTSSLLGQRGWITVAVLAPLATAAQRAASSAMDGQMRHGNFRTE
jgi:hypothetical protein